MLLLTREEEKTLLILWDRKYFKVLIESLDRDI